MKKLITTIWLLFVVAISIAQELPSKSEIISSMRLVNEHWISTHPDPGHRGWDRAVYFTGNQDFYKVYPYYQYLDYSYQWAEKHNWNIDAGIYSTNADQQCAGQLYIDLYRLDPQAEKIEDIKGSIDNMIFWNNTDAWWWIDALYMAMPSFTKLGVMMQDEAYFDQMYKLYTNTKYERGLYNEEIGLWYRDEGFKPPYVTPNGKDSYWARGNGWVFGAHVRVLQELPDDQKNRKEYEETFQAMAEALRLRQREDGFWNVSLEDPEDYGGPETSGTSFFTYGMAWGINNGLLDSATYMPAIIKAWNALNSTAVHEDGFLGYVQGVGVGPSSAQPVTYESTTDYGVGAFLLAGTELVKMANGTMPDTPNLWVTDVNVLSVRQLAVSFNLPIDEQSLVVSNFEITPEVSITSVELGDESNTIVLTMNSLENGRYQLKISESIMSQDGHSLEGVISKDFYYSSVKVVEYSGYEPGTSNIPENTLDFDLGTRWSSNGSGEYIVFDLGQLRLVQSVSIAFFRGDARNTYFDLSTSDDGVTFTEVYTGQSSGDGLDLETFDFDNVNARFVKYTGYGNSQSTWNSITEVSIEYSEPIIDDARLQVIEMDGLTIQDFHPDTLSYTIELEVGTAVVPQITAVPAYSSSVVEVSAADSLPGKTTITVTAADNTTVLVYEVAFLVKLSDDSLLNDLMIDGETVADFDPNVFSYQVVLEGIEIPAVTAFANYTGADVEVIQADKIPGVAMVHVTSESGLFSSSYSINFDTELINALNERSEKLEIFPNPVAHEIHLKY